MPNLEMSSRCVRYTPEVNYNVQHVVNVTYFVTTPQNDCYALPYRSVLFPPYE